MFGVLIGKVGDGAMLVANLQLKARIVSCRKMHLQMIMKESNKIYIWFGHYESQPNKTNLKNASGQKADDNFFTEYKMVLAQNFPLDFFEKLLRKLYV